MAQSERDETADAGLERLLEVEKRLEASLRAAEASAQARVEEARAAARALGEDETGSLDATGRAEDAAELEAHQRALSAIATQVATRIATLEALGVDEVERLAHRAVARLLGEKAGLPP